MSKRRLQSCDDDASFFASFTVSDRATDVFDKRSVSGETSASVLSFFDAEVRSVVSTTEQRQQSGGENARDHDRAYGRDSDQSDPEQNFHEDHETHEEYSSVEDAAFDESHDDDSDENADAVCYERETKRAEKVAKEFELMVTRGISTRRPRDNSKVLKSRTKQRLRKELKETDRELPMVNSLLENLLRESREKREPKTDRPAVSGVECGVLPTKFACNFEGVVTDRDQKRIKVGRSNDSSAVVESTATDQAPTLVEKFVPQVNRLSMVTELYGFQYNLESVFVTDCVLCLDAANQEPDRVSVLVVRDRLGVENYWFPARRILNLCGFVNLRRTVKHRCPPNSAKRFSELRRMYDIKALDLGGNHIYLNEEGVNGIFYGSRFRENIARIDLVRVGVVHFYRARRFVVGELIKQLANEYIQWCLPPV